MKTIFLTTWKRCASQFCEGSTDLELQIIDMELLGANSVFGKYEKVLKLVPNTWYQVLGTRYLVPSAWYFDTFSDFSKHRICSQKFHINDLEL